MKWLSIVAPHQGGHTVVASALDEHPSVILAEEADYVRKVVREKWTRDQVVKACITDCAAYRDGGTPWPKWRRNTAPMPRSLGFKGIVQGEPKVAGNKMGWELYGPAMMGWDWRSLFEKAMAPVVYLHVIRDPREVIHSWWDRRKLPALPREIPAYIDHFDRSMDAIARVFYRGQPAPLQVYLEDFCQETEAELTRIAEYLGVEARSDWLACCRDGVWSEPRKRAHPWGEPEEKRIEEVIKRYPWLSRYESAPR